MRKYIGSCFVLLAILFCSPQTMNAQWVQMAKLNGGVVSSFAQIGTYLFAGADYGATGGGVFLSTDSGNSWTSTDTISFKKFVGVTSLAVIDTNLFAGTHGGGGVFLTTNNGALWTQVNNGYTGSTVFALTRDGSN